MTASERRCWRVAALSIAALACLADAGAAQRPARITDVQIAPPEAQIRVGERQPFFATAYDAAGSPVVSAVFRWSSSNPAVVTVDADGIALGAGAGLAIITVRSGTGAGAKSAQAPVRVTAAAPGQPAPGQVALPAMPSLRPQAQPQRAAAPADSGLPSPPSATGIQPGTAAMAREPQGSGEPDALLAVPVNLVLVPGEQRQLAYRFVRADGENAAPQPVVFEVSGGQNGVARVDSLGLVVAGQQAGRVLVHAVHPGNPRLAATVNVEVRADSVRFARSRVVLPPAATDTLQLVVPGQARTLELGARIFSFSSSDTTKVFVRPQMPIVETRGTGAATITAESPYYAYRVSVPVVVHRPVATLASDRPDSVLTLAVGQSMPLGVRALAGDSSPVTAALLTWTRPDSNIARYDSAAEVLRGIRAGETRLAVAAMRDRGRQVERQWLLRVVPAGVGVSRSRVGLGAGDGTSISTSALDGRRQPIGPIQNVVWSSSADSVVRVTGGRLVGVRMGRARVTAHAPWDSTATVEAFVVGDLVVSALRDRRWDLYAVMMSDPSAMSPLTRDTLRESEAAWAPDLTRLAYVAWPSSRAKTSDLYVMDADGGGARRLTNDSAVVASPSFVPPIGERIVFESGRGGRSRIYSMNLDGTGRRMLGGGEAENRAPRVSPDGRKVVFTSTRGGSEAVYEMDIDGNGVRRLTAGRRPETLPVYGPQGRTVWFLRDEGGGTRRLYRVDLESGSESSITPPGTAVESFAISADGSTIALSLSVRGPMGQTEPRFGFVSAADPRFQPLPLGRGEQITAAAFRPVTPPGP